MPKGKPVFWSRPAKQDLRRIWSYYARAASREVADALIREIDERVHHLDREGSTPGTTRNEVKAGLRSVRSHPHTIFFRLGKSEIEIVRVLHDHRNFPGLIATGEQ